MSNLQNFSNDQHRFQIIKIFTDLYRVYRYIIVKLTESICEIVLSKSLIRNHIMYPVIVVVLVRFFYPILSTNNRGGRSCLIILEIVSSHNLHPEQLLASFSFSPIFLLCSTTAFLPGILRSTYFPCHFYFKI